MASKKIGRLAGLAALAGLAYMNKDKLFGAKDKTPDAAKSESKNKSYDRDTDTGVDAIASDAVKKPAVDLGEIRDEEGRLSTLRRNTETGETYDPIGSNPVKVASVSSPASKPAQTSRFAPVGSPVAKAAAGTGNAKAVVAPGGDRSARLDMPKAGKIGNAKAVVAQGGNRSARSDTQSSGKTGNASPVVAQGGNRSTRSDNAKPVFAPGGDRSTRSDNAKPVVAEGGYRGARSFDYENDETEKMKRGGKVKKMASGGMTSSASKRGDGIATKGKTRGRMC